MSENPHAEGSENDDGRSETFGSPGRVLGNYFRVLNFIDGRRAGKLAEAGELGLATILNFAFLGIGLTILLEFAMLDPHQRGITTLSDGGLMMAILVALLIAPLIPLINAVLGLLLHPAYRLVGGKGKLATTLRIAAAIPTALAPISVLVDALIARFASSAGMSNDEMPVASAIIVFGIIAGPSVLSLAHVHAIPAMRSAAAYAIYTVVVCVAVFFLISEYGREFGLA